MSDGLDGELLARVRQINTHQIVAELGRRGYEVKRDGPPAPETLSVGEPGPEAKQPSLAHFPDRVLIGAATERGFEVRSRAHSASDDGGELAHPSTLVEALDDTLTRHQMRAAYAEMQKLQKKRHRGEENE